MNLCTYHTRKLSKGFEALLEEIIVCGLLVVARKSRTDSISVQAQHRLHEVDQEDGTSDCKDCLITTAQFYTVHGLKTEVNSCCILGVFSPKVKIGEYKPYS